MVAVNCALCGSVQVDKSVTFTMHDEITGFNAFLRDVDEIVDGLFAGPGRSVLAGAVVSIDGDQSYLSSYIPPLQRLPGSGSGRTHRDRSAFEELATGYGLSTKSSLALAKFRHRTSFQHLRSGAARERYTFSACSIHRSHRG